MKLINSQKNNAAKKQEQELYPKVKTFSRAYAFSPSSPEPTETQNSQAPSFRLDERPYPLVTPSYDAGNAFDEPERIDLQDTLLTDESFAERLPERQPSAVKPDPADASAEAADHNQYMESEPSQVSSDPDEAGLYLDDGSDLIRETESFYQPEPETEYEADPFYNPESVTDDEEDSGNIHSFNTKEKA